jgi:flagellar biosynthetic protein FlhB
VLRTVVLGTHGLRAAAVLRRRRGGHHRGEPGPVARRDVAGRPIKPNFAKLNPAAGLKRLFSLDSVVNAIKSILKLGVLGLVTWIGAARGTGPSWCRSPRPDPRRSWRSLRSLSLRLVFLTGLSFLVIALADYVYQLFMKLEKSLKMTKQEVILEHKESEGDPQIKGPDPPDAAQRARQRMLQAVPRADVVITNPTHVAVALQYDPSVSAAPIVLAMGERKLAERIKAIAREAGVPLVENKPIARALLATCVVGKPIPPGLYGAVAEILAFVYRLRNPRYGRDAREGVA